MNKFFAAFLSVLGAGDPQFVREERVEAMIAEIRETLACLPRLMRITLTLGMIFFEFLAPLLAGKFGRFSRLSVENRKSVFLHFQSHPVYLLRMLFFTVRNICVLPLFSGADFLASINYAGEKRGC